MKGLSLMVPTRSAADPHARAGFVTSMIFLWRREAESGIQPATKPRGPWVGRLECSGSGGSTYP